MLCAKLEYELWKNKKGYHDFLLDHQQNPRVTEKEKEGKMAK